MLHKIGTFNSLVDLIVLFEGYFHVPKKVYDEILKDYYEIWRKVHTEGRKQMRVKTFPIKNYELDFSKTSFDFLNELDPKPSINVKFTLSDETFFDLLSPPANYPKNIGFMQIDLTSPKRVVIDLIEHELSHYVQDYIQKYRRIKKGEQNVNVYSPKMPIGGLPTKSIIDSQYTTQGYKIGSKQKRRAGHSLRPVEYYPDLLSAIRHLEYAFGMDNPDYSYDPEEPTKYETEKKQFFLNFLNKIKYGEKTGIPLPAHIFKTFKTISPEFYKRIVKIAYDAFVNKDPNLNVRELIKIENEIENIVPVAKKVQQNFNMLFNFYKDEMIYSDVYDFAKDFLQNYFEITDGSSATGESVISNIGSNDGVEGYSGKLPHKGKDVVAMFKRLKKYKDANNDIFTNVDRPKILYNGEEEYFQQKHIQPAYKSLFENLKDHYYNNAINDVSRENFKKWIDNFQF